MRRVIALLFAWLGIAGNFHRCGLSTGWPDQTAPRLVAARAAAGSVHSYDTDHFTIWWTDAGIHAIKGTGPSGVAPGDIVPRLVRSAATGLEKAWRVYVDSLGYQAPKSAPYALFWGNAPNAGRYPVELGNIAASGIINGPAGDAYFGIDKHHQAGSSAMMLAADVANFGPWSYSREFDGAAVGTNYATSWDVTMQATAAHELFHAVQYRYENTSDLHVLYESSAVFMETQVIPGEVDYLQFLGNSRSCVDLSCMEHLTPFLVADGQLGYSHAWFIRSLAQDSGIEMVRKLWEKRSDNPRSSVLATLRNRLGSLDESFARYALRVALTGRRAGWSPSALDVFSDAKNFIRISETVAPSDSTVPLDLATSAIQIWVDTVVGTNDRIVNWIPEEGVRLLRAKRISGSSTYENCPGSVRIDASESSANVWGFANPGTPKALWAVSQASSGRSRIWTTAAPARSSVAAGQTFRWQSGGAALAGAGKADASVTPLVHLDLWRPSTLVDPYAASIVDQAGGHAVVLEDADRLLTLSGATLTLPYTGSSAAWIGRSDGIWISVPVTGGANASVVQLGDLDLKTPLRVLVTMGEAPQPIVSDPRPNPSRGGASIRFPISGLSDGASLHIVAQDGTVVRRLRAQVGQTEVPWNLRNEDGDRVKPGVYWYIWRGARGSRRGEVLVAP